MCAVLVMGVAADWLTRPYPTPLTRPARREVTFRAPPQLGAVARRGEAVSARRTCWRKLLPVSAHLGTGWQVVVTW